MRQINFVSIIQFNNCVDNMKGMYKMNGYMTSLHSNVHLCPEPWLTGFKPKGHFSSQDTQRSYGAL